MLFASSVITDYDVAILVTYITKPERKRNAGIIASIIRKNQKLKDTKDPFVYFNGMTYSLDGDAYLVKSTELHNSLDVEMIRYLSAVRQTEFNQGQLRMFLTSRGDTIQTWQEFLDFYPSSIHPELLDNISGYTRNNPAWWPTVGKHQKDNFYRYIEPIFLTNAALRYML